MAQENAREYLEKSIDRIRHKDDMTVNACRRLQEILGLKKYPRRMECYDISNISGVDKVGSMVVFIDGEAERSSYRRFRIKTVEGANDFASLQEVLLRRLAKLGTDEEERFPRPDLIIIDGGKGQLSAVKKIFDKNGIEGIELISLAKREEEVFTLDRDDSVKIDHRDFATQNVTENKGRGAPLCHNLFPQPSLQAQFRERALRNRGRGQEKAHRPYE